MVAYRSLGNPSVWRQRLLTQTPWVVVVVVVVVVVAIGGYAGAKQGK
jgi:hypothetical protein